MITPDIITIQYSSDEDLPDSIPPPKGKGKAAVGTSSSTKKRTSDAAADADLDDLLTSNKRAKATTSEEASKPAVRGQNWTADETTALLQVVRRILPAGQVAWKSVAEIHGKWSVSHGRKVREWGSLERKYKTLAAARPPTGDPNIPPDVLEAKKIERAIFNNNGTVVLDDTKQDVKPTIKSEVKPKIKSEIKPDIKPTVKLGKETGTTPSSTTHPRHPSSLVASHDTDDDAIVETDSKGRSKKVVVSHKLPDTKRESASSSRHRKGRELTDSLASFLGPEETTKRQEQRISLVTGLMSDDRVRRLEERLLNSELQRAAAEAENRILQSYLTTGAGWGKGSQMNHGFGEGGASSGSLAHFGGGMSGSPSGGGQALGAGVSRAMGGGMAGHSNWERISMTSPATGVRFQQNSNDGFDLATGTDGSHQWFSVTSPQTATPYTGMDAIGQAPSTPIRPLATPSLAALPSDHLDTRNIPTGSDIGTAPFCNTMGNIDMQFNTHTPVQGTSTNSLTISITPTKRNANFD